MVRMPREVQRERGAERHDHDRHLFRDEQDDDDRDDQEQYVDVVHDEYPSLDEG